MKELLPQQKEWNNTQMIAQGAEGRVYLVQSSEIVSQGFFNTRKFIFKHRLSKAYRHPDLDKSILASRLSAESRNILRALECGVDAPYVWRVDQDGIWLEYIEGVSLRILFDDTKHRKLHLDLCREIGRHIGKLHESDLIHGDLTTSNIMVRYKKYAKNKEIVYYQDDNSNHLQGESNLSAQKLQNGALNIEDLNLKMPVFIDFGLSYVSTQAEDKAVDLYVLERAILSTHTQASELFQAILEGYSETEQGELVLKTFEKVRLRGRKRDMIG